MEFSEIELNVRYPIEHNYMLGAEDKAYVIGTFSAQHNPIYKAVPPDFLNKLGADIYWRTGRGQKLTTRLKALLFREHKVKADEYDLKAVGNFFSARIMAEGLLFFDFTDTFDWKDGEFGDGGSCFWGGRSWSRKVIKDNGGRAVRFYKQEAGKVKGFARAWVGRCDQGFVIFNVYGTTIRAMANVLAGIFGMQARAVTSKSDSDIYFNTGGAWSISKKEIRQWDLTWRSMVVCPICKKISPYDKTTALISSERDEDGHLVGYCAECRKGLLFCPCCKREISNGSLREFLPKGNLYTNSYFQCKLCYEIIGTRCGLCKKFAYGREIERRGNMLVHRQCEAGEA